VNLQLILESALRCEAAYIMDPAACRASMEDQGMEWVGQYKVGAVQAALTMREGAAYLSISGTRFADDQVEDLLHDLDVDDKDVGGGAKVARGAYCGLPALWQWVFKGLPSSAAVWVEGHSLGGWRAYYSPLFCPASRLAGIFAFESPKAGNAEFWKQYDRADTVSVVHERDVFWHYPFVTTWGASHPPHEHLWLVDGSLLSVLPEDVPMGVSLTDHDLSAVVAALRAVKP